MARPLDDYRRKRDFARTPEPAPREDPRRGPAPVFVVHRHDARRLHYDLRLEMGGVLCSWAVPKGFSYDPRDKHLAIRTEDHPLEYEDFHGVIPRGQYGAGTMTIWDRGTWGLALGEDPRAEVEKGEVKMLLFGRKLRGEWHLVRTGEERQWLLFKSKDRYAGGQRDTVLGIEMEAAVEAPLPRSVRPMEPDPEPRAPFSDPAWVFELFFEGRRVLAVKEGDAVRLRGLRARLPDVEAGLRELRAEAALVDGVLVSTDVHGRPSRELLDERLSGRGDAPVHLYVFDLLHYEGFDLRREALVDRKAALRSVLRTTESVLFVDHVPGRGESLVEAAADSGMGSVLAKRAASTYGSGPSSDWLRIPVRVQAGRRDVPVGEALKARPRRHGARVRFSNLDKVYWPAEGYTKGDLLAYYEHVADWLLPYLFERPVHMKRYPDGIEGKSFYQRQAKETMPGWIETEMIHSGTHGEEIPHVVCNDRDTLLALVNLGSIDLHPWLSRRATPHSPDWAVLDLDPKEAPFLDVVRIARETGRILHAIGLRPLLKTSGKTGLHVYVPLLEGYSYDQSRMFCEGVARLVARNLPEIATVERVVGNRGGKVYVDFGQNRKGQTVVPPYVPRPVRGATVSTPLAWDELSDDLTPARFTIQTVLPRFDRLGDLFAPALTDRQDLLPAIEALGGLLD